jgi:DNA-binding GntR family transcriptional regulator
MVVARRSLVRTRHHHCRDERTYWCCTLLKETRLRPCPPRSQPFTFKLLVEEREMLEALARKNGETMSQALRRLLRQAVQRRTEQVAAK